VFICALAGKAILKMTYFVSSGTLNFYSVIDCCCAGYGSNVLQVSSLPAGLPCSQLDSYLSDLVTCFSVRRFDIVRDSWPVTSSTADTVDGCCVLAVFDSDEAALTALTCQSSSKYRLQPYTG